MQARVIFSLGATNPAPPSTCRGTMVKAAKPPARISWRRERPGGRGGLLVWAMFLDSESSVFMAKPQNSLGELGVSGRRDAFSTQGGDPSTCWRLLIPT